MPTTLLCSSAICCYTDSKMGLIPDRIIAITLSLLLIEASIAGTLLNAFIGAIALGAALASIYLLTRGEGIGGGDVKLAAVIGAALGLRLGFLALAIAFIAGATIAIILLALGHVQRKSTIKFAPYLCIGIIGALLTKGLLP